MIGKHNLKISFLNYPELFFFLIVKWLQKCLSNTNNSVYSQSFYIIKINENCFKLTKEKSRMYPAKIITDYADDMALLAKAETLLYILERAAVGISLHVNAHKTEYMCFNQTGDISTLNGSSLKLVDKFTYQESSVSSTETDINTRLAKALAAIDRLSVIWKSDLANKMKPSFFPSSGRVDTAIWMHYMDAS